jgi:hypothetical protein
MQLFLTLAITTPCHNLGFVMSCILYKVIESFASDLAWCGMGKCDKYVHDRSRIFTHIRGLKAEKMCKMSAI